ncbi:DUF2867 domain-containing protein [Amycolatopsis regifaucium]|uniref:DUF2867 domain-containing protein n=1 Tax=Amycolatopsis regifaucium TaxID=546365 RepID=A0A154MUT0_9PSEU|nr:DUF2867 domain-containing protein [Amycolatopsis regifaucium]KZB88056.1 hypothetical protein AVL48_18960 [Amycolatopsis regifaucium]OKA04441.1 hypothetical protein ATP06_0231545 [Amycolatopsis regifaucium]SFH49204.1 Protein of unknown function [Amycolatopsis regifaucium]
MKLANTAHTTRSWRIHEIAVDFELEDVWALGTPGGPGDFPKLIEQFASGNFPDGAPAIVRALWSLRWKLGALFQLDKRDSGLDTRVGSLRDRLPEDLRDTPTGPDEEWLPFTPVYRLDDEFAAELANRTMHGVLHLARIEDGPGCYRGQLAVLVKPNGRFGRAYMGFIKPFRYLFVYPALMRMIEREWKARS